MQINEVSHVIYRALDLINAQSVREFTVPPQTFIGAGALARCGEAMAERDLKCVFVMVDGFLHKQGIDEGLYRSLEGANIKYEIITYAGGEPTTQIVEAAAKQLLAAQCDSVLALGGGSVLDAAKATAMLAANVDLPIENLANKAIKLKKRLPLIAIPTTAGTGSEATNIAVITDTTNDVKQVLVHPQLIPDLAIIDACLTLGVPSEITAITGIDALTHAIETYVACHATPLTKGFAYRAITLIGEALPHAVGQGNDIPARESMMLASYMAGMAFSNGGLGLCHAMAHQIGGKYHIPHGMCNAIMLPAVMRFNQLVCKKEYAEIGHALTGKQIEAEDTIKAIQQLIYDVGLCKKLGEFGGSPEDIPQLAEAAMQDICLTTNPRTVTQEQIIAVYQDALAS
ncbi:iron-containing alcohol dehydrogenase [Entomomonas sp. E2T0]|uniref:iron-containing alcohol dehydrogenase family protein n=1 Tax=Entomomonas sp. E2T0 TaxID=2930213 RepID=UPI0022281620|nr:iron-containing alcohol dehydrogenase [Entomomonas sp. E2T0]UYZ83668.1 iron-containing alcohol dehydrogenase [Entomomonas sp. E2T0]